MVMAGGPSRVKEELKMSTSEDLGTGNIAQNQEQPVMPGISNADALGAQRSESGVCPSPGLSWQLQGARSPYERLEADIVAEIGLEELNGLEMEVMRRQMQVISGWLHALEDRDATWCHKDVVLCSLLVSLCAAHLWLWMRQ